MKAPRTEAEILTAIDTARSTARCLEIDADALDLKADTIFKHAPATKHELARQWRKQAADKRRRASNLATGRIVRLSRQLAAVRTLPLPSMGGGIRKHQTPSSKLQLN